LKNRAEVIEKVRNLISEAQLGDEVLAIGRQIAWLEQIRVETEAAVKRGVKARVIGIKEGRAASYADILLSLKVGFKFNPIDHGDARIVITNNKAVVAFPNTINRKETEKQYTGFFVDCKEVTAYLKKLFDEYWENAKPISKSAFKRFISDHETAIVSIASAILGAVALVIFQRTLA